MDNKTEEDILKEDANTEAEDISTKTPDTEENVSEEAAGDIASENEAKEAVSKKDKKKRDKKDKKEKKDQKDVKIDELNDRLVRLMAEYDNYIKRTDREKSAMYEMGVKSIVEKILPVIDNFERGFMCLTEEDNDNPFVQGMEKIYEQFTGTLNEAGIVAIEAVDKEFDPNLHNAVMHIDDDSYGTNIVVEEFQKGYMYRDAVIRYSMVKVAN